MTLIHPTKADIRQALKEIFERIDKEQQEKDRRGKIATTEKSEEKLPQISRPDQGGGKITTTLEGETVAKLPPSHKSDARQCIEILNRILNRLPDPLFAPLPATYLRGSQ